MNSATQGGHVTTADGGGRPVPKLGTPAARALAKADVRCLADVASLREIDLRCMHGIGDKAIERLRDALAAAGLAFRDG
jgi:hypothetical protein